MNQNLAVNHRRGHSVCIIRMNPNLADDLRRGYFVCIMRMNQNLAVNHRRGHSVCIIRMNPNLAVDHRRDNSVCITRMNQNLADDHRRGNSVCLQQPHTQSRITLDLLKQCFAMYIAGARFEENCFSTSTVIRDWVLCCFRETTYDVITYLICRMENREYLQNEKKIIPKRKNPWNKQQYVFYTS